MRYVPWVSIALLMHSMQQSYRNLFLFVKSKASVLLRNRFINLLRGVPLPDITGEKAQRRIALEIKGGRKLVARVGETEGRAVVFYLRNRKNEASVISYPAEVRERLKLLAGFFPCTDQKIDEFCRLYINSIREIDIYAAWTPHDRLLMPRGSILCRLYDLDPFFTMTKWTSILKGQRVTVVNPFKKTILEQYKRNDLLFQNNALPSIQLSVVQAPMTQCEQEVDGQDWFENLHSMQQEIKHQNPEVVIIGAGAYGLPLGAYAKHLGCSAVVLGGSTQLLFGIIGSRWENDRRYRRLINEYWCRPSLDERPKGYQNFEIKGGAYW
jgi:hypothetical protein